MIDLLSLHKQFILTHVKEGDICAPCSFMPAKNKQVIF